MAKIDLNREIRRAVDTGKIVFGEKQTEKSLNAGKAEAVILAKNAKKNAREKIAHFAHTFKIPMIEFEGTGLELGAVCGKPFTISALAVAKAGKSKILSAAK